MGTLKKKELEDREAACGCQMKLVYNIFCKYVQEKISLFPDVTVHNGVGHAYAMGGYWSKVMVHALTVDIGRSNYYLNAAINIRIYRGEKERYLTLDCWSGFTGKIYSVTWSPKMNMDKLVKDLEAEVDAVVKIASEELKQAWLLETDK